MLKMLLNILIIWGLYSLFTSPKFEYLAKFVKITVGALVSPFM